jgi:hypothetical protein
MKAIHGFDDAPMLVVRFKGLPRVVLGPDGRQLATLGPRPSFWARMWTAPVVRLHDPQDRLLVRAARRTLRVGWDVEGADGPHGMVRCRRRNGHAEVAVVGGPAEGALLAWDGKRSGQARRGIVTGPTGSVLAHIHRGDRVPETITPPDGLELTRNDYVVDLPPESARADRTLVVGLLVCWHVQEFTEVS